MKSWQLQQRQSLSLEDKIILTKRKIKDWAKYWDNEIYVSFSGGKDSTVLLHIVRSLFPDTLGVFVDTGLEYPEIKRFVKQTENIKWLKPSMRFYEVIDKYGYPIVSKENAQKIEEIRNTKSEKLLNKRLYGDDKGYGKLPEKWKYLIDTDFKISAKCCDIMKKRPIKKFEKETGLKPIVGIMASDSSGRTTSYLRNGCNSFNSNRPVSNPLGFWLEQDIWDYLKQYNVPYSNIYSKGYTRTGCMFCMFGVHLEKGENRFQLMKHTHTPQYNYCINKLGCGKVLDTINVEY